MIIPKVMKFNEFLHKNSVFFYPKLYGCWGKGGGVGSQRVIQVNFQSKKFYWVP